MGMPKKYVVLKNFVNTDYLLRIANHEEAVPSKIGKLVDSSKKRRMDQVFDEETTKNIDKLVYRKAKKSSMIIFKFISDIANHGK